MTPVPYWMDRRRRRGRDHLHSLTRASPKPPQCGSSSDAGEEPRPVPRLALFASYSYHGFFGTDRDAGNPERPTPPVNSSPRLVFAVPPV